MIKAVKVKLMEVCGTHTMAIARAGIKRLLPKTVELISGPGCPVCVTAQSAIDQAIAIAQLRDVILATFGDMMRVPGTSGSLEQVKSQGQDVRLVYSCLDALSIARDNPQRKVVFMGVGFETTSPTIAATILEAKRYGVKNFFILSNFKLIAPALFALAQSRKVRIDGFILPGHVSVITGSTPYEQLARHYKRPAVITGFDEIDIIKGIRRLIELIKNHKYKVEIEYKRAVRKQGNSKARKILFSVFAVQDAEWRGLGVIKKSGLKLREEFRDFSGELICVNALVDANQRAFISDLSTPELKGIALGTFHTTIGLAALPAGLIAGFLWENIAPRASFIYGSIISTIAVILFVFFRRLT